MIKLTDFHIDQTAWQQVLMNLFTQLPVAELGLNFALILTVEGSKGIVII